MRKIAWVWVLVAFVAGLLPGAGVAWWVRTQAVGARDQLVSRNSELHAENQLLLTRLNAAEATVSALNARLQTATAASSSSATGSAAGATSTGAPTGKPTITERTASPEKVKAGAELTLAVKLTGTAKRVNVRIAGPSGFDKTYFLGRKSYNATGETWEKVIDAPASSGEYRYYAIAYDEAGAKYPMPGVSGWTFLVE